MAENSQWYYVENQDRKGPVTSSTIKQLVSRGVINEQTLVWKEGMKDWEPAKTIKGLIESPSEARASDSVPKVNVAPTASKPRSSQKVFTPPDEDTPRVTPLQNVSKNTSSEASSTAADSATSTPKPTPIPVTSHPTVTPTTEPESAASANEVSIQASSPAESRSRLISHANWMERFQFVGYPCLVAGFLLVIFSKGCDSLGNRWASRLSANSQMAEDKFDYQYTRKRNSLQSQIDSLNDNDNPDTDRINNLQKQITDLTREQSQERQRLMKTTWFELAAAAKTARANNQAWGFFRELGFVFGSMVLSIGLLVLGITGNASEKWTCLIMLAIITFSIYIGGFAWFSSIAGSMPGGMGF